MTEERPRGRAGSPPSRPGTALALPARVVAAGVAGGAAATGLAVVATNYSPLPPDGQEMFGWPGYAVISVFLATLAAGLRELVACLSAAYSRVRLPTRVGLGVAALSVGAGAVFVYLAEGTPVLWVPRGPLGGGPVELVRPFPGHLQLPGLLLLGAGFCQALALAGGRAGARRAPGR